MRQSALAPSFTESEFDSFFYEFFKYMNAPWCSFYLRVTDVFCFCFFGNALENFFGFEIFGLISIVANVSDPNNLPETLSSITL